MKFRDYLFGLGERTTQGAEEMTGRYRDIIITGTSTGKRIRYRYVRTFRGSVRAYFGAVTAKKSYTIAGSAVLESLLFVARNGDHGMGRGRLRRAIVIRDKAPNNARITRLLRDTMHQTIKLGYIKTT